MLGWKLMSVGKSLREVLHKQPYRLRVCTPCECVCVCVGGWVSVVVHTYVPVCVSVSV